MTGWACNHQGLVLRTRDKVGAHHSFYYWVDDHGFPEFHDFSVHVRAVNQWPAYDDQFYTMSLKVKDSETIQTIYMENKDLPELRGKGISEALIIELSRVLHRNVLSSPTFDDMSERRSASATTIWERLVATKAAVAVGDRFLVTNEIAKTFPSPPPPLPSGTR